jgi:hypothetical protein
VIVLSVSHWLNNNQGVVTAAGLVLAVLTGLFAYYTFILGRRVFHVLLFEALYEALHNLRHIADAYKGESPSRLYWPGPSEVKRWPEYELRYAAGLLDPPYVDYLDETLGNYLDHMLRNDTYIRRLPHTASGLREAADSVGYLAEGVMRFLLVARHQQKPEAVAIFDHLEAKEKLSELTKLRRGRDFPLCAIRLSETKARAHACKHVEELGGSAPLVYWFTRYDQPTCLYGQLVGLDDPPPRASRPKLLTRLRLRLASSSLAVWFPGTRFPST